MRVEVNDVAATETGAAVDVVDCENSVGMTEIGVSEETAVDERDNSDSEDDVVGVT